MTPEQQYKKRMEHLELFLEYAQHEIYRLYKDSRGIVTNFNANPAVQILLRDLNLIYQAGDLGYGTWAASTTVVMGYIIEINGSLLIATNDGTTDATQPSVPSNIGDQVTDGTVTWERIYDSPITAWDQRFTNLLTTHGITNTDYEHYNCLRPPRLWQPGDTLAVSDVIVRRYEDITATDTVHTYPTTPPIDTTGACLNAGPPTGAAPPPGVPDNYYEVCANVWIPIPTFDSYTTTEYTAKLMVVLFYCSAAGTVGTVPPDYLDTNAHPSINYDDVITHDGTAELRVRGVFDFVDGTYVATTLTNFPEQKIPCA